MTSRLQIQLDGQEAGRQGRPNPVAREDVSDAGLQRFHAWHLATIERELGRKLLPGAPSPDEPDLMICRPEPAKEDL